jgi:hypothetical protein
MYKDLNIKISQMILFYLRFNEIVKSTLMIITCIITCKWMHKYNQ